MINKLKIGLLVIMLSVVWVSFAQAVDLTFSEATNISIGGYTYVISAGSQAKTVVVNGNTITIDTTGFGAFTLTSAAGSIFNNNGSLVPSCSSGASTIVVPADHAAVVITPFVGATCASGSGGLTSGSTTTTTSGGGGGGGGSSSSSSTTPVTITVTPVSTTVEPGCSGGNKYNTSTGALCVNTAVVAAKYNFGTTTLKNGSKGDAVKELQRFLNANLNLGLVIDGKLGPKTIAVIKKWQKANGLVVDGLIGPKTKAMMNASVK
jgi:hypothetical protein